jgi:transcriptional activator HAC1
VGTLAANGPVSTTSNITDGLFGADFSLLPASDIDNWGAQDQLSPSTDPLNFEYNHLASDATTELPEFDINQFLSDDVSGAASGATAGHDSIPQEPDSTFSFFDFENQIPTETFNQQPHLGASTHGCDDGVLAVGV